MADLKAEVIKKLIYLNRRASADEIALKVHLSKPEKAMLKAREFDSFAEYLAQRLVFMDEIVHKFMLTDAVTFQQLFEACDHISHQILTVAGNDGVILGNPLFNDLFKFILFEDIQRTLQAFNKYRYLQFGQNYKAYKVFLKNLDIPEDKIF